MSPQSWLLFLYKVPPETTSRRVYVWRKMKRLGAILLHDSAWVLPATPRTREQFQWLAAEVEEMSGEAFVWESRLAYGQEAMLVRQFAAQTEAAYLRLLTELTRPDADLAALARQYQQALAQDYFRSDLAQQVYAAFGKARGGTDLCDG